MFLSFIFFFSFMSSCYYLSVGSPIWLLKAYLPVRRSQDFASELRVATQGMVRFIIV
jgi:translation elongation factor EF-G